MPPPKVHLLCPCDVTPGCQWLWVLRRLECFRNRQRHQPKKLSHAVNQGALHSQPAVSATRFLTLRLLAQRSWTSQFEEPQTDLTLFFACVCCSFLFWNATKSYAGAVNIAAFFGVHIYVIWLKFSEVEPPPVKDQFQGIQISCFGITISWSLRGRN